MVSKTNWPIVLELVLEKWTRLKVHLYFQPRKSRRFKSEKEMFVGDYQFLFS